MPKIPTYTAQEKIPASSGLVRVDVAEAGAPGRALMQEGAALQRAGTELAGTIRRLQEIDDQAAVVKALDQFNEKTRELQYGSNGPGGQVLGVMAAEGEAALGIHDKAKAYLTNSIGEISKSLANKNQQRWFGERAGVLVNSTLNAIARHEVGERAKVVDYSVENDLQRTLGLIAENAGDSDTVGELVRTHIETVSRLLPGRPDVYSRHYVKMLASQAEGLAGDNPLEAHKLADGAKDLMKHEDYLKLKQSIDMKEAQADVMISPVDTMMKAGMMDSEGNYAFYKSLPTEKRLALLASINAQIQHQQAVIKQQKEIEQEEIKSQVFDLVREGKTVEAEQRIEQLSRERKIDFQTAKTLSDFLRADSKISDPDTKLETWEKVLSGRISSGQIKELAIRGDLSAEDAISMMKKKRELSDNAAQSAALRSLTSRTVIDEAKKIIDPGGALSTPETKAMMMKFAADYERASKGQGFDPIEFWNSNGWRYTPGSVPSLWDGSRPKSLEDVTAAKGRLTRSGLPVAKQNIEAEKLQHAEKVLRETERIRNNVRNKPTR